MPTYEYACQKCGHEFEIHQSMKDEPLKKCPKCKKAGLKRLVGAGAGLIFKGTGFYITDYRKSGAKSEGAEKPSGGGEKPASASTADKGATKPKSSDAKSAAK